MRSYQANGIGANLLCAGCFTVEQKDLKQCGWIIYKNPIMFDFEEAISKLKS